MKVKLRIIQEFLWVEDRLCGLATNPEVRVRFPEIPDFKRSSGSGTGSNQPCEYNWVLLGRNNSVSGLENRDYGRRDPTRWLPGTLYPHKLALTSLTSDDRSVGILRSRTQVTEFTLFFLWLQTSTCIQIPLILFTDTSQFLMYMSIFGD
jgi:hypothetical protein